MRILVDDSDLWILSAYNWWLHKGTTTYYARANTDRGRIYLHRYIMSPEEGKVVDHLNGNGLDNRRSNLRVVTLSTNGHNRVKTKYPKGVRFHRGQYRAVFTHPLLGYKIILDSFLSPAEAHNKYCDYVKKNFPEFLYILLPKHVADEVR